MTAFALLGLLWIGALVRPGGGESISPESIRAAPGVKDPVFGFLVALLDDDLYGTVDEKVLDGVVRRSGEKSDLPYRGLRALTREQGKGRFDGAIHAVFEDGIDLPIPYSILGYKPGRVRGTHSVSFRDLPLGTFDFEMQEGDSVLRSRITNVRIFALREGELRIDIDAWLDALMGGSLDDTRVTGLALFEAGGERWALAMGYNREWEGRSGVLNLADNRIRFPTPNPLKTAARKLRQVLEAYEPTVRPDSLRSNGGW